MKALVEETLSAVMAKSMDEIRMLPAFTTVEMAVEKGIVKLANDGRAALDSLYKLDWVLTIALVILCAVIYFGNAIYKIVKPRDSQDQKPSVALLAVSEKSDQPPEI